MAFTVFARLASIEPPVAGDVRMLRTRHNLTQEQAASMVHGKPRNWRNWESDPAKMPLAEWELFCIKLGDKP